MGTLQSVFLGTNKLLATLLLLTFFLPVTNAQQRTDYNSAELLDPVAVDITSFSVIGENPLKPRATHAVLKPFLGVNKTIADIESAVKRLEAKLKKEGYSFYRVEVTSQELVDGEIELTVRRYRIGEIRVTGNRYYSDENILASVPQLSRGQSPSTALMSRSLRVANQNSGKRTLLQLEASPTANELDASIQVVDQQPMVISAWVNNTGTKITGRYRVGLSLEHRNVFKRDHIVNVSFVTSPEEFEAVKQSAITYQLPLYKLGGKINFIAVKSDIDTGTVAEVFDVAGRGDVLGAGYTQVLPSFGKFRHQVGTQLTDKFFENDILFSGQQIGPDVRSRPLTVSYQANWQNKNLALGMALGYTKNINGGRFNDQLSYQNSRSGADNDWESHTADASLRYSLSEWQFTGNLSYSGSSNRLITGEQFALGGANSIRGMEERELSGDKGYRLGLQVWAPPLKYGFRPVLFLDTGKIENNDPEIDEIVKESVASVGASIYWNPTPRTNLSVSLGHLIDGVDTERAEASDLSQDGDSRLHINFAYRF